MKNVVLLLTLVSYHTVVSQGGFDQCFTVPTECPNRNITFWLYTRSNAANPYQILYDNELSVQNAPLIPNAPTLISIHGYNGNSRDQLNPPLISAYLRNGDYNIIAVDYGVFVREPCYITAALNIKVVGKCIAAMLDTLILSRGLVLSLVHVIGFSLGAHAAGELSDNLKSGRLERITGLDPAMPLFVTPINLRMLSSGDARFVDVIHTSALYYGKLQPIGHVDFYVNGGTEQPGCNRPIRRLQARCNHERSIEYYAESVNSQVGFYGRRCDSLTKYILGLCDYSKYSEELIMGFKTPQRARGMFFVTTSDRVPFARGSRFSQQR